MALPKMLAVEEKPVLGLGLVAPPPIRVEFKNFDGSLGQLFTCVRERKIDLAGVPLLPICEAYFRYLITQEDPNLEESAAALAALSYLLERKAFLLLPTADLPVEEDDILAIGEGSIHEFFEVVAFLRGEYEVRSHLHFRSTSQGPYELPYQIESITVRVLAEALEQVLNKIEKPIVQHVTRVGRSLAIEMRNLLSRITAAWKPFDGFFDESSTLEDAVYVFLSLLELIRLGQVQARIHEGLIQFGRPQAQRSA